MFPLFLDSCSTDIVFVTLLRTAVETAVSEAHKLLRTGGVPTSLTLVFWWWPTVSSGRSAHGRAIHPPPPPPPTTVPNKPHGFCERYVTACLLTYLPDARSTGLNTSVHLGHYGGSHPSLPTKDSNYYLTDCNSWVSQISCLTSVFFCFLSR